MQKTKGILFKLLNQFTPDCSGSSSSRTTPLRAWGSSPRSGPSWSSQTSRGVTLKTLYPKVWGLIRLIFRKEWNIITLDLPQVLIISQNIGGQLQIHTDWPSPLRWALMSDRWTRYVIEYTRETTRISWLNCTPNELHIMDGKSYIK